MRANRRGRRCAEVGIVVVARVNEHVAHAYRTQQVQRIVDPIEIVERRRAAAQELLQRRSVAAVTVDDRMSVRQRGVLIRQRRCDRPFDNRQLDGAARRLLGQPPVGTAIAWTAAGVDRRHAQRSGPPFSEHGRADQERRRRARARREPGQHPREPESREHAERHQHDHAQAGRYPKAVHARDHPRNPEIRSPRKQRWDQAAGSGPRDNTRAAAANTAYRDRGAAPFAARPQRGGGRHQNHQAGKQLALGEVVAVRQHRPDARGQRSGHIGSQVGAEDRPVAVRPDESVLAPHGQIRGRDDADAREDAGGGDRQPSGGAQPIRAGHRVRRELADHDERRRHRQIVEKVAVREGLRDERGDEHREPGRADAGRVVHRRHEPVQAPQARSASSPTPAPGDVRRAARAAVKTRTSARRGTPRRGVRSARAPAGTSRSRRGHRSEEMPRRSRESGCRSARPAARRTRRSPACAPRTRSCGGSETGSARPRTRGGREAAGRRPSPAPSS